MSPCALMDILSHRKSPLQVRSASSVNVLQGINMNKGMNMSVAMDNWYVNMDMHKGMPI